MSALPSPYLFPEEAADLLRTTRRALYCLVHRKQIPFIKRGRRLLFSSSDLTKWLSAKRVVPPKGGRP